MAELFAKYSELKIVRKEFILPRGSFTFRSKQPLKMEKEVFQAQRTARGVWRCWGPGWGGLGGEGRSQMYISVPAPLLPMSREWVIHLDLEEILLSFQVSLDFFLLLWEARQQCAGHKTCNIRPLHSSLGSLGTSSVTVIRSLSLPKPPFCYYLQLYFFLGQFQVHRKIERKIQRCLIPTLPRHMPASPILNTPHQSGTFVNIDEPRLMHRYHLNCGNKKKISEGVRNKQAEHRGFLWQ